MTTERTKPLAQDVWDKTVDIVFFSVAVFIIAYVVTHAGL